MAMPVAGSVDPATGRRPHRGPAGSGPGRVSEVAPGDGGQDTSDAQEGERARLGHGVDGDDQAVRLVVDPGEGVERVPVPAGASVAEGQGPEAVIGAGRVVGDRGDEPEEGPAR